jgi:hypothetical protein
MSKGPAELLMWLESEDCFWEVHTSLQKLQWSEGRPTMLPPFEVCFFTLLRLSEEVQSSVLADLQGGIAKCLRVLEHPRILDILARAVEEEDFHAEPHYVRFTISLVVRCLSACTSPGKGHIQR